MNAQRLGNEAKYSPRGKEDSEQFSVAEGCLIKFMRI